MYVPVTTLDVVVASDNESVTQLSESTFTGPGEVLVAPETWGDIVPIHLDGHTQWSVGKDAYLACTIGVTHKPKPQGVGKALSMSSPRGPAHEYGVVEILTLLAVSGKFLSAFNLIGAGIMWVTSLGAIYSRTLQPGEQWIGASFWSFVFEGL